MKSTTTGAIPRSLLIVLPTAPSVSLADRCRRAWWAGSSSWCRLNATQFCVNRGTDSPGRNSCCNSEVVMWRRLLSEYLQQSMTITMIPDTNWVHVPHLSTPAPQSRNDSITTSRLALIVVYVALTKPQCQIWSLSLKYLKAPQRQICTEGRALHTPYLGRGASGCRPNTANPCEVELSRLNLEQMPPGIQTPFQSQHWHTSADWTWINAICSTCFFTTLVNWFSHVCLYMNDLYR